MLKIAGIKLYSLEEVSKQLGITLRAVRNYVYSGKIRFQKIGGKVYISEESLKEFLQGSFFEKKRKERRKKK
ncbi:MAG: helix-turn-helix domain-containing protein [Acidobacteriota bacterium]